MTFTFTPIGRIHSPFKEKFGIPRQPGLVPAARGTLELLPPYDRDEAVRELKGFSHIWVIFVFHQASRGEWSPTVRPPRLGGNQRVGVFATRSPFRPNPIGLSVVTLDKIDRQDGKLLLHVSGIDLLDGTPVLDIKPYVPYVDALPAAHAGFAPQAPDLELTVVFSETAARQCEHHSADYPGLRELIEQILRNDPRPAYYGEPAGRAEFGMRLLDFDVKWQWEDSRITVTALEQVT